MRVQFWGAPIRLRFLRRITPWVFIGVSLFAVRLSKGVVFSDVYSLMIRPFWPGSAQKEWLQRSIQTEQYARLQLLIEDNQRLRSLLSLEKSALSKGLISAAVISRRSTGWWQQLELGKGSLNGISEGDIVIGPGGLLGRIGSVTPTTSRVLLLTAPSSRVAVWIPRNKHHGMLIGRGTNRPQLTFVDRTPKVLPGDLVSTSPASTLMPPNIPVGVIQSIDFSALPSPNAVIQLIAAPHAIDWVQVKTR